MKNIHKTSEPNSLTKHRCNTHSDYDNYSEKDDLREALVTEQKGLCCYCLQRIKPRQDKMKIEHWRAQSTYPARQLEYANLLGACRGGHGQRKRDQHCDTLKGDCDISFNPADSSHNVEKLFKFPGTGRIECISGDSETQRQLDEVLNLNHSRIVSNRKAVLDSFRQGLKNKGMTNADLQRELQKWEGADEIKLEPYSHVVVYYLRKKLNRL